jgi:type IV pilus assembly protein PilV
MKTGQQGVALLEALIAILILAIGLLGTIGLQARAYSALSEAGMRAEATMASEKLIGIMANDQGALQGTLPDYALAAEQEPSARLAPWYAETRALIPGATILVTVTPDGNRLCQVDITISWTRKVGDKLNVHRLTSYIAAS